MSAMVRVLLVGARGRMGRAVSTAASSHDNVTIALECDRGADLTSGISECDVVIDFSHADATEAVCSASVAAGKPLVIGTTGHSLDQIGAIHRAAASIPVVLAPNFSVGVNTLFWLTRKAVELLGDGFDVEIVETHHRLKKDAPSGTAKRLAEVVCESRRLAYERDVAHGRVGQIGERPANQIGMHAVRGGDVVGDHTVVFANAGERMELAHKASSRETFAAGALRAARWVAGKSPKLYSMEDVLGLNDARA
ncbi:MAG TPA: 4-hydroxy-tetrahydrodipicolinate reductase [Chthoniobacterales bacterium]|nr:4-hydroxy-tetrahydrodipicolinate reductase [Chthoniobacterales bacterium]